MKTWPVTWSRQDDGSTHCSACDTTFAPPKSCACPPIDTSQPIEVEHGNPYKEQTLAIADRVEKLADASRDLRNEVRAAARGEGNPDHVEHAPLEQQLIEQERKCLVVMLDVYKALHRSRAIEIGAAEARRLREGAN